jgi:hypothetical protein
MQCSKCRNESIVYQPYSGQHLCRDHFIDDLEAKAKRAIRVHQWMRPGDVIGVPRTDDVAAEALLFFLLKLTANRRDIRVLAIPVSGKSAGYHGVAGTPGMTKIASATTLEDVAASALAKILQGNIGRCVSPGNGDSGTLPRVTPFSHIPADEVATYARICGISAESSSPSQENDPLYREVAGMLLDYSRRHPAAPHAILNLCESLSRTCRKTDEVSLHGA